MNTRTDIYGYVMARLAEKRIPQRRVATESSVPFSTLAKIARGSIKGPSVHHVQALYDYFQKVGSGECANQQDRKAA